MRFSYGLVFIFFCFLAVLVYHTVMQEMILWKARDRMQVATEQVQSAENQVAQAKRKIHELSGALSSANSKKTELVKAKIDVANADKEISSNLQTCNMHKAEIMKKKKSQDENLQKQKADQEREKNAATQEVRGLKEQISVREKKLCQLVDTKDDEARKLCETAEARK